jgi:hypothetical protein
MGKESSNQQNHQLKTSLHTSAPRNPRPNFTLSSEIGHLRRASLVDEGEICGNPHLRIEMWGTLFLPAGLLSPLDVAAYAEALVGVRADAADDLVHGVA